MNIEYLVVHHTASNASPATHQFDPVNTFHKNKDWGGGAKAPKSSLGFYVQYHHFIEMDGTDRQVANYNELRWHAGAINNKALGICMAGNFDAQMPTEAQKMALRSRLLKLQAQFAVPLQKVVPHRFFMPKTCYGKNLSDVWAQKLLTNNKIMYEFAVVEGTGTYGILEKTPMTETFYKASNENHLKQMALVGGLNILNPDGSVNFASAKKIKN